MEVVDDEKALLTFVTQFLVDLRFVDPASYRAGEEGAVVHSAHVIACSTEAEGDPEHQHSCVDPARVFPFIEAEKAPLEDVWRKNR